MPRFNISADDAHGPLVVGIDIGSGGTRAAVYDVSGREVGKLTHKEPHEFTVGADGTSTIDADTVVREIRDSLAAVLGGDLPGTVRAIGFDTFASSLIAVDASGNALTPCITYADTRCSAQVDVLARSLDVDDLHERTGARMHSSYTAPRLAWLRQAHPDVFARTERFMALGEYAALKLLGTSALGTASAAWSGMIDRRTGQYIPELLEAVGVDPSAMGTALDPSDALPVAGTPLASEFPQLKDAVWLPVIGDGLAANMGIGALGSGTWGISTATSGAIRQLLDTEIASLPSGLWAYRVDQRRTLVGSAMSDCGRVLDWARFQLAIPEDISETDTTTLFSAPPSTGTPLVIPFFSGERGTKWRGSSRALFANVGASTTAEDMLRGAMEGVALSFLRIAEQMREAGGEPERIVLSGGMTEAIPAWLHLLSDAIGAPIDHVAVSRSTMRGSAVMALEQASPDTKVAEVPVLNRVEPVAEHTEYYRERLERFEKLADLA
ncbi:gluconokinase [Brachybacterium alimentarium]|uniref:gluconokinase n=1 Tax=Brachybacterium alimentarium TaxID=47845 RepID=UPI000DF46168|nr:gluconokinase [Brachybacterium alimentarium]RCS80146.1 sugar kinase [Brachybacterium alimentarium]RCS82254.1 sugar kinase [Brachybacterium alimentarium]RCS92336.1 sugar kinase [Brachybacterium alimentarium]